MYLKAKVIELAIFDPFEPYEDIFILSRGPNNTGYLSMNKNGYPSWPGYTMWDQQLEIEKATLGDLFQISLLILKQEVECKYTV